MVGRVGERLRWKNRCSVEVCHTAIRCVANTIRASPTGRSCACISRRWAFFFFSSRRRHTRFDCDWSSDVCSSDLTKTSAVEFLLGSIFQHFPPHKGRVAAVCFNVKGPDLCFLDQPGALEDEDRRRYERLGVRAQPFEGVRYYAPFKADGVNLNTLRTHPDLVGDVEA